jgi:hypothetical protein
VNYPGNHRTPVTVDALLSIDYDDTLRGNEAQVNAVIKGSPLAIAAGLNSGRTLKGLQHHILENRTLGQMDRLNFMLLNDSGELYVNTKNLPTLDWIASLTPQKQWPSWRRLLHDVNQWQEWPIRQALPGALVKTYPQLKKTPKVAYHDWKYQQFSVQDQPVVLFTIPHTPQFMLGYTVEAKQGELSPQQKDFLRGIGQNVLTTLENKLNKPMYLASYIVEESRMMFKILPVGVDKAYGLPFVNQFLFAAKRIFHLGDSENDLPAFRLTQVGQTPVTGIVCGTNAAVRDELGNRQHMTFLEDKDKKKSLAEGLASALDESPNDTRRA